MTAADPVPARFGPSPAVKTFVSVFILFNFFCIFTVVTGTSAPIGAPAPTPNRWYSFFTRYYVQPLFLTNPYQFYAPNPGPTNIVWICVEYQDHKFVWIEVPNRDDFVMRMPYQRNLSLAMFTETMLISGPGTAEKPEGTYELTPMGKVAIASFVRHVAHVYADRHPDGVNVPIDNIMIYRAFHYILEPKFVRMEMSAYDIRSYNMWFVGKYDTDGERITKSKRDDLAGVKASDFATDMFVDYLFTAMKYYPNLPKDELMAKIGFPKPFRELATRYPALWNPQLDGEAFLTLLRNSVEGSGNLQEKQKWQDRGMYTPNQW